MLQIRSEQIQSIRQEINLSFRKEIISLLEENGYEPILNQSNNDIGIKDKGGKTSWLRYNQETLPSSFELPSGTSYQLNYYPDGALQSIQMPNGNAISFFTKDGKLINLSHKGGASVNLKYTKDHKVKEIKVSKKKKYEFKYDDNYGYLNAIIDGNKQKKIFNHDNSGNLRQKIDAENRTTYFHYEVGKDELKYIQYPDGSRETYRFDEDDNYLEITQRNNAWVKNFYDDNDNLRQAEWQDGSFILFEYDEKDEVSSIQNEDSLINFRKDNKGQITEEEGEFGSIKYDYYQDDQLSKVVYPDNYEIKYGYDIDSELSEVSDSDGNVYKFAYDAKTATSRVIFGNGNVEYATREHFNGQIAETSLNTQNGNSYGQLYEYDDQERLSKISDTRSKFPSRTLQYDDADHLLAVKTDKEEIIEQFSYDRSGQLTSANNKNVVVGPMEETRAYGENVLTYDANGNLIDFLGVKAKFKQNSTLETLEAKGQQWHYQYDAFGRRISKSNGRETTHYIWAGVQLYEEVRLDNGAETRQKYLYRPFEQMPFAIKNEKGLYLLQKDQRGAIIRAVSSLGELVWEAEYDAFGKAYIRTEKIHQPWRLQGQYFDAESDLHYNVGRYYSPVLKTYLSRDPRWYEVQASNYNYANNDPYNKADSLGAFWHIVGGAIIGGVLAYAAGDDWRVGAVEGAVTAALTPFMGPNLAGGFGSAAGTLVDNYLNDKNESLACAFVEGYVFGKIFGRLEKIVGNNRFVKNLLGRLKVGLNNKAKGILEGTQNLIEKSKKLKATVTSKAKRAYKKAFGKQGKFNKTAIKSMDGFSDNIEALAKKEGMTVDEYKILQQKTAEDLHFEDAVAMKSIRNQVPHPDSDTLMQKVIPKEQLDSYFNGRQIKGSVAKAADAKHLETIPEIHNGLRLDYDTPTGRQFKVDDETVMVIRFKTNNPKDMKTRYNERMDVNGNDIDAPPYTGHGVTGGKEGTLGVPEYKMSQPADISEGEIYEVFPDGTEVLIGEFDKSLDRFKPVN